MTAVRITDTTTRAEIADLIADLRQRASRYSIHDPKRAALDERCDALVDDWLAASE